MRTNSSPKKIPVMYWNEVKLNADLLHIIGILKCQDNKVYVLQEWS